MRSSTIKIRHDMIVFYVLKPKDGPTNPDKLWSGRVICVEGCYLVVELLEPGYLGLREIISVSQVKGVELL